MKISIVIPNYNGKRLLEKNLPKVIAACKKWEDDWEIVVVYDGSSDDSVDFLKKNYPEIRVVQHKKNLYFAAACNSGVRKAKGEVVVLLNNDAVPEKNFLKPLLVHFKDPQVFAVGCKEKSIVKGKIVFSGRSEGKFQRGFLVHWRAKDQNKKNTLWVAGGSGAFRKRIWEKLGGMDILFRPVYWEDIDLSYRALKAGFKVLFEPKSIVFHQHETTTSKVFGKKRARIFAYKNQILFVWKNITDWSLLFRHFFWLPYHLVKGPREFLLGFLLALKQLREVINSRRKANKYFILEDQKFI